MLLSGGEHSADTLNLDDASTNWLYRMEEGSWQTDMAQIESQALLDDPYRDAVESMSLLIRGANEAEVIRNVHALRSKLDGAARFARDEATSAVRVSRTYGGVTYEALVLGGELKTTRKLDPDGHGGLMMRGATLTLRRRGLMLTASATTATSTSAPQGQTHTVSFIADPTAQDPYGPVTVTWLNLSNPGASQPGPGIMALAPNVNALLVHDSASMTTAGSAWSTIAEASALGGNVRRFNPGSVAAGSLRLSPITLGVRAALYVMLRNNSAAHSWLVRGFAETDGVRYYTDYSVVDGSYLLPQVVPLGVVTGGGPKYLSTVGIEILPTATGGTIDIDCLANISLEQSPLSIAWVEKFRPDLSSIFGSYELVFDDRYTLSQSPLVYGRPAGGGATRMPVGNTGDAMMLGRDPNAPSTQYAGLLMMPDGSSWCITTTRLNVQMRISRRRPSLL